MHLKVNIGSKETKGAEGMVFWITKEQPQEGMIKFYNYQVGLIIINIYPEYLKE